MKVIITKYAVTLGVMVIEAETFADYPHMIRGKTEPGRPRPYYHRNEWHQHKKDAVLDVQTRFTKKRESLSRQLNKLADKMQAALEVIEKAEL